MRLIEEKWRQFDPNHPYEYFFLDESFDSLYRAEERLASIFTSFSMFAVFIGCLGLFGLASFTAEQRTKEIGIRKALGSSVNSIIMLLCREFIRLIVIANLVAWPVAYFVMNQWMNNFPYSAGIGIPVFIIAAVLALMIAIMTVSYQSVKAAYTNPVKALRYQ
ncbi:MAG: FtsX-like permease family protein [bacterium]|nr:FtsX-like permease family protein [bacterium]